MKILQKAVILSFFLLPFWCAGQTVIWQDEFNYPSDATSPSVGTRTPDLEDGGDDIGGSQNYYFGRCRQSPSKVVYSATLGVLTTVSFSNYSNTSGTWFWAGEQHDDIPGSSLPELKVVWADMNIQGFNGLIFSGSFAASTSGFDFSDYLVVEYKIDGGAWTEGIYISKHGSNTSWAVDTDGDGDGDSPILAKTFQNLSFVISGTGSELQLRLRVAVNGDNREWAVDNFHLIACNLSPPTITATENSGNTNNDGTICSGASVTLGTSSGPYDSYAWSPGGQSSPIIVVSPLSTTTYSLTVTEGGCSTTNIRTITVVTPPSPTITVSENSGTPNNGVICAGESAALSVGAFAAYNWSGGTPSGGTNPTGQTTMVSPATTTTYTVTVTNSAGCTGTDNQQITVVQSPSPTIVVTETSGTANNDGIICEGASVSLNPGNFPGSTFSWLPGGATSSTLNPTPSSTTTYSVTVTNASGCSGTDSQIITVNPSPDAMITSSNASMCLGATRTLTASPSGGTFTIQSGPGSISGGNTLHANSPGTIVIKYTVTVGGCTGETTQVIIVGASLTPIIAVSEQSASQNDDGIICIGDYLELDAGDYQSYFWTPGGATSRTIEPVLTESATYKVEVTDQTGCEGEDEIFITVLPIGAFTIDTILQEDQYLLIAEKVFNKDNPSDSLVLAGASHTGCDSVIYVNITVVPVGVDTYSGFSPNDDGVNETFVLPELNLALHVNNRLLVFNRWGDLVLEAAPYVNNWNGNLMGRSGQPLPAGTYYYILWLDKSKNDIIEGEVIIVR